MKRIQNLRREVPMEQASHGLKRNSKDQTKTNHKKRAKIITHRGQDLLQGRLNLKYLVHK